MLGEVIRKQGVEELFIQDNLCNLLNIHDIIGSVVELKLFIHRKENTDKSVDKTNNSVIPKAYYIIISF